MKLKKKLKLLIDLNKRSNKNLIRVLLEIIYFRFNSQRLSPYEYMDYRLYDDNLYSSEQKKQFVGHRNFHQFHKNVFDEGWMSIVSDKVTVQGLLECYQLPVPELAAIYSPDYNYSQHSARKLKNLDQLSRFLTEPDNHPLFAKKIFGYHGAGAFKINQYNPETGSFELADGSKIDQKDLFKIISTQDHSKDKGFIFQKPLLPHQKIVDLTGNQTVSTLRVVTINTRKSPEIIDISWRIAVGNNMTDNNRNGQNGNLASTVDKTTGNVLKAFSRIGFYEDEVTHHPDTGNKIIGFNLPHWDKLTELCFRATNCFGGLGIQSWDIALCEDGPYIVELNAPGELYPHQCMYRRGYNDSKYQSILSYYLKK